MCKSHASPLLTHLHINTYKLPSLFVSSNWNVLNTFFAHYRLQGFSLHLLVTQFLHAVMELLHARLFHVFWKGKVWNGHGEMAHLLHFAVISFWMLLKWTKPNA